MEICDHADPNVVVYKYINKTWCEVMMLMKEEVPDIFFCWSNSSELCQCGV